MLRKLILTASMLLVVTLSAGVPAHAADHYLGGGVRWIRTVSDIRIDEIGDVDADGQSVVLSYVADPAGAFKFEFDVEYFEDGFGEFSGEILSPQVLLLYGDNFYAGVGAGVNYIEDNLLGEDTSDIYYIGRLGLNLLLLPRVTLDINANYQTNSFDNAINIVEIDTKTTKLGAILRFKF